jgi:predicted AAA+ superfamily ATPase
MRALLRHCYRNTATLISISKLDRDFRSQGLEFGRNTLFEYVRLLEDVGLIFLLPVCARSPRKQARNPRKLHVVDTGLTAAFLPGARRDVGHKLETAVFLENRRRRRDWCYAAGSAEVDLVDGEGATWVNSCWSLTEPGAIAREQMAMAEAQVRWPEGRGVLVYHEHEPAIVKRMDWAVPAWRWLLGGAAG